MSFFQDLQQNPEYFNGVTASTGQREFFTPGFHKAIITKVEEVAAKDKPIETHALLVITFTGLEGDSKGIEIVKRFNIRNPNEQAVNIGKSEILAVFAALGYVAPAVPKTPNEMMNKPLWLKIKNQAPNDKGRVYPEVAFQYPISFVPPFVGTEPGYVPPVVTPPAAAAAPVAAAAYGTAAAAPQSTPNAGAAYGSDDDIPF